MTLRLPKSPRRLGTELDVQDVDGDELPDHEARAGGVVVVAVCRRDPLHDDSGAGFALRLRHDYRDLDVCLEGDARYLLGDEGGRVGALRLEEPRLDVAGGDEHSNDGEAHEDGLPRLVGPHPVVCQEAKERDDAEHRHANGLGGRGSAGLGGLRRRRRRGALVGETLVVDGPVGAGGAHPQAGDDALSGVQA